MMLQCLTEEQLAIFQKFEPKVFFPPFTVLVLKWLRDKHNIVIEIKKPDYSKDGYHWNIMEIGRFGSLAENQKHLNTWEEAESDALDAALIMLAQRLNITL